VLMMQAKEGEALALMIGHCYSSVLKKLYMPLVLLAGVMEIVLKYETGQANVWAWTACDLIYQTTMLIE
jgi:hypothetical protein